MFQRISHVIVFVRDMDSMLDFWCNKIGLRVQHSSGEWSELVLDNIVLALHKSVRTVPRDTGIIFNVEDIGETVRRLKEKGVEVTSPQDIGVGWQALFKDPEGNTYRIFQPRRET